MAEPKHHVFLLSDGTGETADTLCRAALSQFDINNVEVHKITKVKTIIVILNAVKDAVEHNGIIFYTIVAEELEKILLKESKKHKVKAISLLGQMLKSLAQFFKTKPIAKPGELRKINETYIKRLEAINFTVKHDDGQKLNELSQADIILLGVSRSSKTPISIFLAHKGYKVSNIPLLINQEIPKELFEANQKKVFGLIVDPELLQGVRFRRLKQSGQGSSKYADLKQVSEEIEFARAMYSKNKRWHIINITEKSIEEVSNEIISCLS